MAVDTPVDAAWRIQSRLHECDALTYGSDASALCLAHDGKLSLDPRTPAGYLSGEIADPRLLRLSQHCRDRKGTRGYPARRDIDPLEFPHLLGNMLLLDVLRDPLRFRVRLRGANLAMRAPDDLTGKTLDELPITDCRAYVIERCRGVIETGEPAAVQHDRVLDGSSRRYEALWLPFAEDGEHISMRLCALVYNRS